VTLAKLTIQQRSHIRELQKSARVMELVGYDLRGWPVMFRANDRGTKQYALKPDGTEAQTYGAICHLYRWEAIELGADYTFLSDLGLLGNE